MTANARKVLDALPSAYEPSRCHVSDLMLQTRLSAADVEAALRQLSELGLIEVDKGGADPFHPPEARHFGARRVFAKS